MILCPVCGRGNGDLAVTCVECHGYLQSRVDALDLFATAWGVVENPGRTFRKIALATHKNYTVFLASLFGVFWTFLAFRLTDGGLWLPDLFVIILAAIVVGPLVGVLAMTLACSVALLLGRRMGGNGGFRNVLALASYATIPVAGALVFVLPIEVGIFGISLFGAPPTPWELKPGVFVVLSVINGGLVFWFAGLMVVSLSVGLGLPARKARLVGAMTVGCLSCLLLVPLFFRG